MTLDEVLALLLRRCEEAGSRAAWAEANEVSPAYVSDVLNRRREPGASILDALGLEKVVAYHPKSQKSSHTGFKRQRRVTGGKSA